MPTVVGASSTAAVPTVVALVVLSSTSAAVVGAGGGALWDGFGPRGMGCGTGAPQKRILVWKIRKSENQKIQTRAPDFLIFLIF